MLITVNVKVPLVPSTVAEAPSTGVEGSGPSSSSTPDQPKPTSPVLPSSTSSKSISKAPTGGPQDGPSQAQDAGGERLASAETEKERAGTAFSPPSHSHILCLWCCCDHACLRPPVPSLETALTRTQGPINELPTYENTWKRN